MAGHSFLEAYRIPPIRTSSSGRDYLRVAPGVLSILPSTVSGRRGWVERSPARLSCACRFGSSHRQETKIPPSPLDRRYTLAGFLNFPSNFAVRVPFHRTIGELTMRRQFRRRQRRQLSSRASSRASPGTVTQTATRGSHRRVPVPRRGTANEAPRFSPGRPSHHYENELGEHAFCAEVIWAFEEEWKLLRAENEQLRLEEGRLPPREDDRLRHQIQETASLNHVLATLLSDSSAGGLSVANQIIAAYPTGLLNSGELQATMQAMDANWRQVTAGILQRAPGATLEPRVSAFVADNANTPNFT
ncbi:hypothetical protein PISL3812_09980 [Talaromyces islandicus]|uniref:Uncharacterized protein n=1 Tax=Talaromyces islandicus TaxID=28573 RepID=A0A0U1MBC1_TALIS|nr:hypothetical protein PISL3812_09980 [Talaromyces islandicus]